MFGAFNSIIAVLAMSGLCSLASGHVVRSGHLGTGIQHRGRDIVGTLECRCRFSMIVPTGNGWEYRSAHYVKGAHR